MRRECRCGSGGGTDLIHWRYAGEWLVGTSVTGNGYYRSACGYYDQNQVRWTQTDPAERVINPMQPAEAQPYNYAGCNPVNQTDLTGAASAVGCTLFYAGAGLGTAGLVLGAISARYSGQALGQPFGVCASLGQERLNGCADSESLGGECLPWQ